ncbi:MAG: peptidase dimerization domain-containing protein, partial [Proteobacteria bacterium]|nr:peptidase dimerization domain-containing protein [Pseudomonadota bacterium]
GPIVAQHSGHYGNFVPNPAFHLARILGSMKSADGLVQIAGFYDGIELSDETLKILANVPDDEAAILASMGVAEADKVGGTLQEALQYPSLNIRGLSAGWVGEASRTIIPPTATAEIDIRLVVESDPERLIRLLRSNVAEQGYLVLDRAPTLAERNEHPRIVSFTYNISYNAFRSDFDAAAGLMARAGMQHLYGEEPILIRSMGGSIPIAPIIDALGVPAATVPTVNIDNNQHSPNENLRLGNFIEGIAILMSVLSQSVETEKGD